MKELQGLRENAAAESEQRQALEKEVQQLYGTQQTLQEQLKQCKVAADFFKGKVSTFFQVLDAVLPMLQELRTGSSSGGKIINAIPSNME